MKNCSSSYKVYYSVIKNQKATLGVIVSEKYGFRVLEKLFSFEPKINRNL